MSFSRRTRSSPLSRRALISGLPVAVALGLLAGAASACTVQGEAADDSRADTGGASGGDDGHWGAGGSGNADGGMGSGGESSGGGGAAGGGGDSNGGAGGGGNGGNGGSGGSGGGNVAQRCPDYTRLNNGVGSWFKSGSTSNGTTYGARHTIKTINEGPNSTTFTVSADLTYNSGTSSSTSRSITTGVCDAQGMRYLKSDTHSTITYPGGSKTTHDVSDYGTGLLTMVWDAAPGRSWSSNFTITSTSDGTTTKTAYRYRYKMLGPKHVTPPAGSFDGMDIETTVTVSGDQLDPYRTVHTRELGPVWSAFYPLQSYQLK